MFTGREWLEKVGLYDYRNRMYSPVLGRFLQTDPIKFRAGDINLYRYVGNRYMYFTDPLGLACRNGTWGDALIPDAILGVFDAEGSCGIHDDIYDGVLNAGPVFVNGQWIPNGTVFTRAEADRLWLDHMLYENPNIFGQSFSYIYYSVVRIFGWMFWGGRVK